MKTSLSVLSAVAVLGFGCLRGQAAMPVLRVSDDRHFLVQDDGSPFFYLGDTAWELLHRLNREEAEFYLRDRAAKGFTVIQTVALAELDGLDAPNAYGHRPLRDNDPGRPWVEAGPDNDYWDQVDFVVEKANALGLYVGLLPCWGDKWNPRRGAVAIFDQETARLYGAWLGARYRERGVIWILGGDRPVETSAQRSVLDALAAGLRGAVGRRQLIAFHPPPEAGSARWVGDATWLDFNMRQNGHSAGYGRYGGTLEDYRSSPARPVIDAEPLYEDHPLSFNAAEHGHSIAADVRRALYWDLFNGAFGHVYGHHSVWQMYALGRKGVNAPLMTWREALDQPGAFQMRHGRRLLESRPFLSRVPAPELVLERTPSTAWPGAGIYRFAATRDNRGRYGMIYVPAGRAFSVNLAPLSGKRLRAWWFDPRDGSARLAGEFDKTDSREFVPPAPGELLDWVLVLDDAAQGYGPPGTVSHALPSDPRKP